MSLVESEKGMKITRDRYKEQKKGGKEKKKSTLKLREETRAIQE